MDRYNNKADLIGIQVFEEMTALGLVTAALGLLAIVMTYILAPAASKKEGHYVSGIPGVGGILMTIGFLLTPWKILALAGAVELIYISVQIVPQILLLIADFINWAPPDDLEGEPVMFTSYKNRYEQIKGDDLPNGGYMILPVVRYVIAKSSGSYILYSLDMASRVVRSGSYNTIEECKSAASKFAKWKEVKPEK